MWIVVLSGGRRVNFKMSRRDFMWEHEYELYEEDINRYNERLTYVDVLLRG